MDVLKTITKHFEFEKYLSCIDIEKHLVALSRLRCSAHHLIIEEGRYRGREGEGSSEVKDFILYVL